MSKPDWKFWQQMSVKPWQGCALSLNLDPDNIRFDNYGWMAGSGSGPIFDSESFLSKEIEKEFNKRLRIVIENTSVFTPESLSMSTPHDNKIKVPEFAKGALLLGIEMPDELADMATNVNASQIVVKPPAQDDSREYKSDKLRLMNQAAEIFWKNADPNDRKTHPKNSRVIAWFEDKGFSKTLAEKATTIIRPEWAGTGRIPEE